MFNFPYLLLLKNSVRVCVGHSCYCACSSLCWRSRAEKEEKEYSGKGSGRKEGVWELCC